MAGAYAYRDAAGLARAAQILLCVHAAGSVAEIGFRWARGFDPKRMSPAEGIAVMVQLVLLIAAGAAFLVWQYRANANARAMGADDMRVTPGWSAGWYFVPLANIVMPFIALSELWKASTNPRDWQGLSGPFVIGLWWAFWLGDTISGNLAWVLTRQEEAGASQAADMIGAFSAACSVVAATLLAGLVRDIQARQTRSWPASIY